MIRTHIVTINMVVQLLFTEDQVPVVNEVATHTAEVSNVIGSLDSLKKNATAYKLVYHPC